MRVSRSSRSGSSWHPAPDQLWTLARSLLGLVPLIASILRPWAFFFHNLSLCYICFSRARPFSLVKMSDSAASAATDPNLPHDSLVPHILGIIAGMLALVTLVVGARFWIRFKFTQSRFGADDWCILVAWILAVALSLGAMTGKCFFMHFWVPLRNVSHRFFGHDYNFTIPMQMWSLIANDRNEIWTWPTYLRLASRHKLQCVS